MRSVGRTVAVACAVAMVAVVLVGAGGTSPSRVHHRAQAGGFDLTGIWRANDGGTYWIRQIGSRVWWAGFSGSPTTTSMGLSFSNVFLGTLSTTGSSIKGSWADVPRGATTGSGSLTLSIKSVNTFVRSYASGGFGASIWRRTQ
jgi:hypothetical protein